MEAPKPLEFLPTRVGCIPQGLGVLPTIVRCTP